MRPLWLVLCGMVFGCAAEPGEAPCHDAAYWSERAADWPTDALFVGERSMGLDEALGRLERAPTSAEDTLIAALIVAELDLASGGGDRMLPLVYEGHALLADGVEADEDALAVADALGACDTPR